jgi:hypothetical protein
VGNPLYKSDGDPYELIGFGAPDPFVRRGRAFSFTTPVTPDVAHEFFVEARAPNLGSQLPTILDALDEMGKPLSSDRALAPVNPEIAVTRAEAVPGFMGEPRYYRVGWKE